MNTLEKKSKQEKIIKPFITDDINAKNTQKTILHYKYYSTSITKFLKSFIFIDISLALIHSGEDLEGGWGGGGGGGDQGNQCPLKTVEF